MEQERFDRLTRAVAQGTNRRGLIAVLSGALVSTGLLATPEDTTAKARGRNKHHRTRHGKRQDSERESQPLAQEVASCAKQCRKKSSKQTRRRCRKRCLPPTPECTTSQDCPTGELCESGICLPISDQCGADTDCDACEQCQGGVCVAQCQPEQICRTGQCETVQCTADRDCTGCSRCLEGQCRWQCTVTEVCLSGSGGTGQCCQPRSCPTGLDCGTVDDGCGGQAQCGAGTCPPPSNPCQDAVCTSNVCTTVAGHDGASCDIVPCGTCTSGACSGCTPPQTCGGGGTPGACGCTALRQPCTSAAQCCSTDNKTTCGPNNVIIGNQVCCSTLGGACTAGGPNGDCCGVNVPSGQDYAYCSPDGACGGQGAQCRFNEACLSGQCCGPFVNTVGTCSGPGGCL